MLILSNFRLLNCYLNLLEKVQIQTYTAVGPIFTVHLWNILIWAFRVSPLAHSCWRSTLHCDKIFRVKILGVAMMSILTGVFFASFRILKYLSAEYFILTCNLSSFKITMQLATALFITSLPNFLLLFFLSLQLHVF